MRTTRSSFSVDDVKNLTWDMLVAIWKVFLLLSRTECHITNSDDGFSVIAGGSSERGLYA